MNRPLIPQSKPRSLPLWLESAIILALAIMAIVEARHDQWFWTFVFGLGALFFAPSVISRFLSGDKHN